MDVAFWFGVVCFAMLVITWVVSLIQGVRIIVQEGRRVRQLEAKVRRLRQLLVGVHWKVERGGQANPSVGLPEPAYLWASRAGNARQQFETMVELQQLLTSLTEDQ